MKKIYLEVNPGICGFTCWIETTCSDKITAQTDIAGSGCSIIEQLGAIYPALF